MTPQPHKLPSPTQRTSKTQTPRTPRHTWRAQTTDRSTPPPQHRRPRKTPQTPHILRPDRTMYRNRVSGLRS